MAWPPAKDVVASGMAPPAHPSAAIIVPEISGNND
jgi:hypothetical protein